MPTRPPDGPPIIGIPEQYRMAIEIGNWRAAAYACVVMLRHRADQETWEMRLRGCLRARRRR
jgi:hypothetical protein